jgi:hypothetical protein
MYIRRQRRARCGDEQLADIGLGHDAVGEDHRRRNHDARVPPAAITPAESPRRNRPQFQQRDVGVVAVSRPKKH